MSGRLSAIAWAAGMLAVAQPALANLRSACFRDYARFCAGVSPGEGRVARCLQANRDGLTEPCRNAFSAVASCRHEIERHCRDVAEPSQIKTCLQKNAENLSATCSSNLAKF
jgi:Cysteine rich repeat